jgi:tRNA-dihydrouridine synthase
MAKKPRRRSAKISEATRDKMFEAFCERQSIRYVAKKCRVARTTVVRYLEEDDWLARLQQIREKARKKQDGTAAEMRSRHAGMGKLYQKRAFEYLAANQIKSEIGAITAGQIGVRMEREALGEAGELVQQEIVIRYADGDNDPAQDG